MGAADTEIPRRPAAGGLIAGWSRAAPAGDEIPPAEDAPNRLPGDTPPGADEPGRSGGWDRPAADVPAGVGEPGRSAVGDWERAVARTPPRADEPGRSTVGGWERSAAETADARGPVADQEARGPVADQESGAAGRWDRVVPPGGSAPGTQDHTADRGAAGVDEATTFMSPWGPPAVPQPTDEERRPAAGDRTWGSGPAAPSRTGAGHSAADPVDHEPVTPPRATGAWTRPAAEPATSGTSGPTADRTGTDRATGAWTRPAAESAASGTSGPTADRAADRPGTDRPTAGAAPGRPTTGRLRTDPPRTDGPTTSRPTTGRSAEGAGFGRSAEEAGFAPPDRTGSDRQGSERQGDERPITQSAAERWIADQLAADQLAADQLAADRGSDRAAPERRSVDRVTADPEVRPWTGERFVDEPTEVIGPFDVGAWSLHGREGAAPDRRRQRGQDMRAERAEERAEDRVLAGVGGGGNEPPSGGAGGRGGRNGDGDPHRHTTGDRTRTVIRGIGQTFLTLGVVLLLLATYEVWFTDLVNHRTQSRLKTALEHQWDTGDDPTVGAQTPAKPGVRSIPLGDGFALIYMPDFGTDYVYTVVEGTGADQLNEGPGHYVGTPLPGAVGNVAIAGHRVGKGSPFLNLDKLKAGSAIVIRTKSYWYTYRVLGDSRTGNPDALTSLGIPGREIVDPSNVGVIAAVPDKPGASPTRKLLTLTTCHPKFSARQRMVIHAIQDGAPFPVSKGTPPSMTGK